MLWEHHNFQILNWSSFLFLNQKNFIILMLKFCF
jgi:hypothetical protein